ncbi:unnamed protein product [Rotaria sordida]|uniref:mitogen-activated protein kinase kinase n=1 Tax=Rotaria sordida TaxID=392033 RepID=A0A814XEF7_9BILA|nr:unnamed protein product [Rotaria sordida]
MEEQNVSEPNQNTTLAEEEQLYLQAAFLSDVMQILNPVIDNVENEYMQPVLLDTTSLFIDCELPQPAEYVEDVSNTFGATQPITTNDTMRLDKTPNKTTTRKQKTKRKFILPEFDVLEKPVEYTWEASPESAELIYKDRRIQVNMKDFNVLQYLGQGNFGWVASVNITGHLDVRMAVKRITLSTKEERASARRTELKMMQELGSCKCPYIIDYYGAMIDTYHSELCICMELMDTTVKKFYETMHLLGDILSSSLDRFLCRLIHNIASALEFLAQKNYLHRDIKPDNILLSILGFFKLSDFGTCCEINETNSVQSGLMGTIAYFSPELVKVPSKPSSIQSDMWALGITLLEIVIDKHPCLASNDSDQYLKIATWNPEVPTMIIFDYMQKFILYLLKKESEQRPGSYIEILNMSFIRDLSEQPTNDECNFVADVMQISYECTG